MTIRTSLKSPKVAAIAREWDDAYRRRHNMLAARLSGKKVRELAQEHNCTPQRISQMIIKAKQERDQEFQQEQERQAQQSTVLIAAEPNASSGE